MKEELKKRFCELYRKTYFYVYKRTFFFFRNQELSRDIAQDVFYKVVVELEKGNTKVLELGYLTRLATNLCIDHIRKAGSGTAILVDRELPAGLPAADGPAAVHQAIHIKHLFEKLPASLREIAIYRLVDGYSLDEIVRLTKISKRTLQRKLDKIKKHFD